jgi:hypothetical protein
MAQRGEPMALYGGLKAQFANVDLSSLLPDEIMDRMEANVCLAFGVRPEVLGTLVGLKNSPWSHMSEARKITYQDTIEPMWRATERRLTRQLLPPEDRASRQFIRFDTAGVRALAEDEMLKARVAAINARWWTRDELRMYTGKEPLQDERGEEFGATDNRTPSMPEEQAGRTPHLQAKGGMRDLLWAEFDLSAKAQERVWEPAVAKLLAEQGRDIVALFGAWVTAEGGQPTPESLARFLAEVGDYLGADGARKAREALTPLVSNTAEAAARRITARLGFGWDVVQPGILKYAAEETGFLVSVMGETTGSDVARVVQQALEDRVPLTELRKRLEELPAFDRKRAQLVARTETTRATNGAQVRTAQEFERETGRSVQKSWVSSRDARVREEHAEFDDGEFYPIDHMWAGMNAPGEPG